MEGIIRETAQEISDDMEMQVKFSPILGIEPTSMDTEIQSRLARAADQKCPGQWRHMSSGALHDAANLSHLMPTAMLFVPSIDGISHDFAEDTDEADLVTGLNVLARAVHLGAQT